MKPVDLRCPPSALYTFRLSTGGLARRCLAAHAAGGSPNLTGSITRVSARALKLLSSPLRLPISPSRPRHMVSRQAQIAESGPRFAQQAATKKPRKRGFYSTVLRLWRRGPESNWAGRICNPLHNRFATAPRPLRNITADRQEKGKHLLPFHQLERETRLELATSTLARLRSTN